MISLNRVSKKFNQKTVINDLNFDTKEGEIIGFLGLNGAGKTTTMRLIIGYLYPTDGKISVANANPIQNRMFTLKKIGYLPENNPLYQEMTVDEYLKFISKIKEAREYSPIAQAVGLEEVLQNKIEVLSRGFKQRVGLAAALIGEPQILILDEPTSGLDPLEQEKIRELIKKLANPTSSTNGGLGGSKKTIIFSTHILSEAEEVATRLIIINKGKIVFDGTKPKGKGAVEKLFKKLVRS